MLHFSDGDIYMIKSLDLKKLCEMAKASKLQVELNDELIVWSLDENNEACLDLNDEGSVINFTFISGAEVTSDDPNDLVLVNAINAAFVNDGDLPSCSVCLDVYSDESDEEAIILRASQSLKGGVSEERIADFFEDCQKAVEVMDSVIYGDGDVDDVDDDKE